jgi:transposase
MTASSVMSSTWSASRTQDRPCHAGRRMGQTRRPGGADPDRDSGDPKLVDAAYPASTAIKVIRDNHSAHISKETKAWLASQPAGRFEFTFTPKHGSWLNLVEGFFSKFARSVSRHIRVAWITSIRSRSFTLGPSSSMRRLDMIRISETMN